jgi:hypothetical protein
MFGLSGLPLVVFSSTISYFSSVEDAFLRAARIACRLVFSGESVCQAKEMIKVGTVEFSECRTEATCAETPRHHGSVLAAAR